MMEGAAGEEPSRGSRFSISAARGRSNDRRLLIEDDGLGGHETAGGVAATSASASYGSMPDSGSDMTRSHPGKISPNVPGSIALTDSAQTLAPCPELCCMNATLHLYVVLIPK